MYKLFYLSCSPINLKWIAVLVKAKKKKIAFILHCLGNELVYLVLSFQLLKLILWDTENFVIKQ